MALDLVKNLIASTAALWGIRALSRPLTLGVPRIFLFHRFSSLPQAGRSQADALGAFIRQVKTRCDLLTVSQILCRLYRNERPSRPLAAITVDDGYEDFYRLALPILADHGVPATLYATAGFVDGRNWLWWDALRHLLSRLPKGKLVLELPSQQFELNFRDRSSLEATWSTLADYMVPHNEARVLIFDQLQAAAGNLPRHPPEDVAPMTWQQLREAHAAGIEIGNHTMTHAFLPGLAAEKLHVEVAESKQLLEQHLRTTVTTFAYPNGLAGDHSPEIERVVQAAGHASALLAYPRVFDPREPFRIGRWSASYGEPRLEHILSGASALKLAWSSA